MVGSSRDIKWDCEPGAKGRTDCVTKEFLTLSVAAVLDANAVCGRSTGKVQDACRSKTAEVLMDPNFFVKRLGEYVDYGKGVDYPITEIVFPFYYKYGKEMLRTARIGACLPIRHLAADAKSHFLGCSCRAGYFLEGGEPRFRQIEKELLRAAFPVTKPTVPRR